MPRKAGNGENGSRDDRAHRQQEARKETSVVGGVRG